MPMTAIASGRAKSFKEIQARVDLQSLRLSEESRGCATYCS